MMTWAAIWADGNEDDNDCEAVTSSCIFIYNYSIVALHRIAEHRKKEVHEYILSTTWEVHW